jgi:hypothetical protein
LKHHPDLAPERDEAVRRLAYSLSKNQDFTSLDGLKLIDTPDQGAFAGPRRPAYDDDLSLADIERHIVQNSMRPKPLVDGAQADRGGTNFGRPC